MQERIAWPIWLWLLALALDISIVVAVGVALDDQGLLLALLITLTITIYIWKISRLSIKFEGDWLKVGRARIEVIYISKVQVLDEKEMRLERGRDLDARAHLALRFWIKGGVKIYLSDKRDPTPYWLVSMKNGPALKKLLEAD